MTEVAIEEYCSDNGIQISKCEAIKSLSTTSKSFKVTVRASQRDKLLDANFWPENILVRKFFNRSGNPPRRRTSSLNSSVTSPP